MKRAIASVAAIAALALPATASAATTYDGKVRGGEGATVKLRIAGKGDERMLKSFLVRDLLINCKNSGEAQLSRARITGEALVSGSGEFAIEGSSGGQKLTVTGTLKGKRRATGSLRYSGPTEVDGEERDCDSGKVGWKASR